MPGYDAHVYGGTLQPYGGIAAGRPIGAGVPAGAVLVMGGAAWEGEAVKCEFTMKDSGWPCDKDARSGKRSCLGHDRAEKKLTTEGS